jgi:hypothetical protein
MLAACNESAASSPEATIFMPPALEHTICVSVGFKIGEAMATPINSANQTSTRRAKSLWLVALDMRQIIAELSSFM